MTVHTSAFDAVPDAMGVARQWRPADVRGLPATLRYGPSLAGVALAAARARPRTWVLSDADGAMTGALLEDAIDAVAGVIAGQMQHAAATEILISTGSHRGLVAAVSAAGALGVDVTLVPADAGSEVWQEIVRPTSLAAVDPSTEPVIRAAVPQVRTFDVLAAASSPAGRSLRSVPRPRRLGRMRTLTSGTTRLPRSTERTRLGLDQMAPVVSLMRALDLRRDEPVVVMPAIVHGHGLSVLTAALVCGAPVVLANGASSDELVDVVSRTGAGVLTLVPGQLVALMDELDSEGDHRQAQDEALRRLRRIATGSAPLPAGLVERVQERFGEVLVDFYGSSELGTATIATAADLAEAPGTVGRPAAGVRVTVVDERGSLVPPGVTGRVLVDSPLRVPGSEAGAVEIGDLGHLDGEGRLFIAGRADDVVMVGGNRVSLTRIREWLRAQPGVDTVRLQVVPNHVLHHEIHAEVTGTADPERLHRLAVTELGATHAPRSVRRA